MTLLDAIREASKLGVGTGNHPDDAEYFRGVVEILSVLFLPDVPIHTAKEALNTVLFALDGNP